MNFFTDKYYIDQNAENFGRQRSEIIRAVYYNDASRELLVGLGEGGSIRWKFFLYAAVPPYVFDDFVLSASLGGYYNGFKKNYGPGSEVSDARPTVRSGVAWNEALISKRSQLEKPKTFGISSGSTSEYRVSYSVDAKPMPDAVVNAASEDEAVEKVKEALVILGLNDARISRIAREVNIGV